VRAAVLGCAAGRRAAAAHSTLWPCWEVFTRHILPSSLLPPPADLASSFKSAYDAARETNKALIAAGKHGHSTVAPSPAKAAPAAAGAGSAALAGAGAAPSAGAAAGAAGDDSGAVPVTDSLEAIYGAAAATEAIVSAAGLG